MRSLICFLTLLAASPALPQRPPTPAETQSKADATAAAQGCTGQRSSAQQAKTIMFHYQFDAYQRRPDCTNGYYLDLGDAAMAAGTQEKQLGEGFFAAGEAQYGSGAAKMITAAGLWAIGNFAGAASEYDAAKANFDVGIQLFQHAEEAFWNASDEFGTGYNFYVLGSMY